MGDEVSLKPEAGVGFLGWGSWERAAIPLPTSQRVWGSAVSSPSGVRGRAPENLKFGATWDLKIHYRNALWRVSYYRKAKTLRGRKHSRPSIFYWGGSSPPPGSTPLNIMVIICGVIKLVRLSVVQLWAFADVVLWRHLSLFLVIGRLIRRLNVYMSCVRQNRQRIIWIKRIICEQMQTEFLRFCWKFLSLKLVTGFERIVFHKKMVGN